VPRTKINGDQIQDSNIKNNHISNEGIDAEKVVIKEVIDDTTSISSMEAMINELENKINNTSTTTGSLQMNQITKLGVTASSSEPKEIILDIPQTFNFDRPPIEVLKFVSGNDNILKTLIDFDNSDEDDFENNNFVEFDGTMHLKTKFKKNMIDQGELVNYTSDLNNGIITFNSANENSINGETLLNTGDDLTFETANNNIKDGSIIVYEDGVDITSDISSVDLQNGNITFNNTHTGVITADYTWVEYNEYQVINEQPTTSDNINYQLQNSSIKDGSVIIYKNGNKVTGKLWSQTIDLTNYKTINEINIL
jgi:hypothetical protein